MRESRSIDASVFAEARSRGLDPVIARIVAGRITSDTPLEAVLAPQLQHIASPSLLTDIHRAADRLQQAIGQRAHRGVNGLRCRWLNKSCCDYRITAPLWCVETKLSHWLIGHRLEDGYGISEALVDRLLDSTPLPELLISADCGSSMRQIARLQASGIDVIVTDHHQSLIMVHLRVPMLLSIQIAWIVTTLIRQLLDAWCHGW